MHLLHVPAEARAEHPGVGLRRTVPNAVAVVGELDRLHVELVGDQLGERRRARRRRAPATVSDGSGRRLRRLAVLAQADSAAEHTSRTRSMARDQLGVGRQRVGVGPVGEVHRLARR